MTTRINRAIGIVLAVAVCAFSAPPSWDAEQPGDAQPAAISYAPYHGASGGVQDLGYGRVIEGWD